MTKENLYIIINLLKYQAIAPSFPRPQTSQYIISLDPGLPPPDYLEGLNTKYLGGGFFPIHVKNMFVKWMDHFPKISYENFLKKKYYRVEPTT